MSRSRKDASLERKQGIKRAAEPRSSRPPISGRPWWLAAGVLGVALAGVLLWQLGKPSAKPSPLPPEAPSTPAGATAVPIPKPVSPVAAVSPAEFPTAEAAGEGGGKAASPPHAGSDTARLKAEALAVAQKLQEEFPDQIDPLVILADVHRSLGNTREASVWWQRCLEKDPTRVDVQLGLGRVALTKGNPTEALRCFDAAQAIDDDAPRVQYSRGLALLNLGRAEEARTAFEREVAGASPAALAYHFLGQACLQSGDPAAAKTAFETAVRLDPELWNAHYGLATACARLGLAKEAARHRATFKALKARDLKDSIARDVAYDDRRSLGAIVADVHTRAGDVFMTHGRAAEAREHWLRAAMLDPRATDCRERLAAAAAAADKVSEALGRYRELRRLAPDNPHHLVALGMLHGQMDDWTTAEQQFREAIRLAPERAAGYQALARLELQHRGNFAEARRWAEAAVAHEPDAAGWFLLAQARDKSGDRPGAIAAVERALALAPDNPNYQRVHALLLQNR